MVLRDFVLDWILLDLIIQIEEDYMWRTLLVPASLDYRLDSLNPPEKKSLM